MTRRRRSISRDLKKLRERKYRLRSTTTRFIPDSDSDFAHMGRCFANHLAAHAERFGFSAEQVAKVAAAVEEYRDALARTVDTRTCGPMATRIKNTARAKAEEVIRAAARFLRGRGLADESITSADRLMLNLPERAKRLKRRACPDVAPILTFRGSPAHGDGANRDLQKHILTFANDFDRGSSAKPHGAARLELFAALVPPEWIADAPGLPGRVPTHPHQLLGGSLVYLRSYTTSRFEVEFPVAADGTAMLVLYWGRWADATGAVGPYSKTCVARVEGGATPVYSLPGAARRTNMRIEHVAQQLEAKYVMIERPRQLPEHLEIDERIDAVRMLPAG